MGRAHRNRTSPLALAAALLLCGAVVACADTGANDQKAAGGVAACSTPGTWIDPANRSVLAHGRLTADMAARPVVLLGEHHDNAEHHRWQLHTLAALHGHHPNMAIGFEAFPRRVQPVLDRWIAGELTSHAFLKEVEWAKVWGFDSGLYMPLFHFARQHRVPMLALNVERGLVSKVGREGFDAVPPEDREGVSKPAPPSLAYRQSLARVFGHKKQRHGRPSRQGEMAETLADPAFQRFVEAQLTWDRAMAEAIAGAGDTNGTALVVGILGRGHVEHRWGVPHQLADLGIEDSAVLLPMVLSDDCAGLSPGLADAVFTVPPASDRQPYKPRLGVMIETADGGARVTKVMPGGVAETTGIKAGDVIVNAAGLPIASSGDLIATVKRQAPGTWLPLRIRRRGAAIDRVARFPPPPAQP